MNETPVANTATTPQGQVALGLSNEIRGVKRVVMFSGGIGSWGAANRVVERFGAENLFLLFADTKMEDEDLYRFINEAAANVGGELVTLCDGRTPWQVYEDERFIGNSRIDPCSKILKRKLLDKWRNENCDPSNTVIYFGIDWTEAHRIKRTAARNPGWRYEAPLCERPFVQKSDLLRDLKLSGIEPPRLYKLGFAHNNCGGFCCKAGKKHFALLLRTMRDRFMEHEREELRLRSLGINGTIFKGGITLRAFREAIESGELKQTEFTDDLAAGCGCALE